MSVVIHRFTPPTCTLEIKGQQSPLYRWLNKDVFENFKFQLNFDDPRIADSQQITITGDRLGLELLKTAVDGYIQKFSNSSFDTFFDSKIQQNFSNNIPYIRSKNLTECELFFGNLQRNTNANKIVLSTVQLFDLITALEAYETKIGVLIGLEKKESLKLIFLWTGIAAVAIAGMGISEILYQPLSPKNITSSTETLNSTTKFNDVIAPKIENLSQKPTPKPKLSPFISSTKRLPPPLSVDTPKSKPKISNPFENPFAETTHHSELQKLTAAKTQAKITIPTKILPKTKINIETTVNTESSNPNQSLTNYSRKKQVLELAPILDNQAQEVQYFFQERWQPPKDLKQSLEYRLYLNASGSIKRIVPIGKASSLYLNTSNIPVKGEIFVSSHNQPQNLIIRLLLKPDGGVKTFLE